MRWGGALRGLSGAMWGCDGRAHRVFERRALWHRGLAEAGTGKGVCCVVLDGVLRVFAAR
jgi:hypothetical protein